MREEGGEGKRGGGRASRRTCAYVVANRYVFPSAGLFEMERRRGGEVVEQDVVDVWAG